MAKVTITKTAALGEYGDYSVASAADLALTAADVANKNQFLFRPRDLLIVQNTDAGAQTFTVSSVADRKTGRIEDITAYSLAAGEIAVVGPFLDGDGWMQADGYIYVEASAATVKFGVVQQPR